MKLHSQLPVSHLFFKQWAPDGQEVGVVIAKALFRRHADGNLRAEPRPEIEMQDVFEGDAGWTPLRVEQDIAPVKHGADLTVAAVARAPTDHPKAEWGVEVDIPNQLHYGFMVRGPSVWTLSAKRWERTAPEPVREVPLSYALAFGGAAPGPDGDIVYEFNPAGIGLVSPQRLAEGADIPIPQIGLMAEFMGDSPLSEMTVMGTGPIAKSWLPRRAFAGTLDADWLADRHPRLPHDFDPQFWNAAPGGLQLKAGLCGDEVISVSGVSGTPDALHVPLPKVQCMLQVDGQTHVMALDTVHLDLTARAPDAHRVTLVWRMQLDAPARFAQAEITSARLETSHGTFGRASFGQIRQDHLPRS